MALAIEDLNKYLASRSYIQGYTPSQADNVVLDNISAKPIPNELNHVIRWYNHMQSYSVQDKQDFPGERQLIADYNIEGTRTTTSEASNTKDDNDDDDDDFDLFGGTSNEEVDKMKKNMEEEAKARADKKKQNAKSSLVLEVKPWSDETDMGKLEECVRSVKMEGLLWGVSKLEPVVAGIYKLQIAAVVYDELVSTYELEENVTSFSDHVQSCDIVSFQKI